MTSINLFLEHGPNEVLRRRRRIQLAGRWASIGLESHPWGRGGKWLTVFNWWLWFLMSRCCSSCLFVKIKKIAEFFEVDRELSLTWRQGGTVYKRNYQSWHVKISTSIRPGTAVNIWEWELISGQVADCLKFLTYLVFPDNHGIRSLRTIPKNHRSNPSFFWCG